MKESITPTSMGRFNLISIYINKFDFMCESTNLACESTKIYQSKNSICNLQMPWVFQVFHVCHRIPWVFQVGRHSIWDIYIYLDRTIHPATIRPRTIHPWTIRPRTIHPWTIRPRTIRPWTIRP